jgi:hypothetical protein
MNTENFILTNRKLYTKKKARKLFSEYLEDGGDLIAVKKKKVCI